MASKEKNWINNPASAVLMGLALLAIIVYLGALTMNAVKEGRYIGRPETERDTITITGEGRVIAVPDVGQITVSIVTEDEDSNTAQERNIEQFNQVVSAVKNLGISDEDLRTTGYNVYPRYDWIEGERILRGYEVNQSLEVKIRDVENAGAVIRAAGQNGVNQVSGLNFTIDELEEYRQEARVKALENAREKAEDLADIMNVTLGKIVSFSESSSGQTPTPIYRDLALSEAGIGGGGGVPEPEFQAGSEEVIIMATIEYEIY